MNSIDSPTTDQHTPKLTPELSKFIENLGIYFESFGVPRIGGRMLGLLLVTPEPLSAESISATLKVSRASVSTNLRMLLQVGWAERASFPGNRTTYYVFPENGFENTLTVEIQAMNILKRFVEQGLNTLPAGDAARNRLEALNNWAAFLIQVWQKALTEWRERQEAISKK
jgi:DNA-binding transcriptional regulator GbsR (MarR family)